MTADPRAVLAAAFVAAAQSEGLAPDPALRLFAGQPVPRLRPGAGTPLAGPHDLGTLHEQLVTGDDRTRRGAWYTPRWLAEDLVARALDGPHVPAGVVADPACGGGVFLLAAAEHLVARGEPAAEVVRRLWGCDVDPVAVAVAEAALWWWSARAGCPTVLRDAVVVGDALDDTAVPPAAAVVGNPPFLGQLRRSTAATDDRRDRWRARFGPVLRAYTDPAWLFLVVGADAVAPGGRVALVQPQSVVAARDASRVRDAVLAGSELVELWVDDGRAFDAGVSVCAPVLERRRTAATAAAPGSGDPWTDRHADARGVPRVDLPGRRRLGELADVHAGFRDEYYGLTDAVVDGGAGPRLVTAGAIDPCVVRVDAPVRFAGRRWDDPRVDVAALAGRARRWAELQAGPSLLVATQTRVLEAVADPGGALFASVPVLCVRPHDPERLWHLLAALHAPAASAWALRRTTGTALSADACKPTAAVLADLPVPDDGAAWDRAARLARGVSAGDGDLVALARAADAALGVDDASLMAWWDARRPRR